MNNDRLVGAGVIWSFWEGQPPDLVLRCFESIRIHNPSRSFIVLSRSTLSKFLDPSIDFPLFHGNRGTPDDFSKVQYLADWVRLKLLEKYGGVWLDASIICTSSVDDWITATDRNPSREVGGDLASPGGRPTDEGDVIRDAVADENDQIERPAAAAAFDGDDNVIDMFPMHANDNVHGNWAMAALGPGNPVVRAWLREMNDIFDDIGPRREPAEYIDRVMTENAVVRRRWNEPRSPPLPYLWVYLALQVVLDREPGLHSHIRLRSSASGPMYRRHMYNIVRGIEDGDEVSRATADHLATEPLDVDGPDRWFIKLVGTDRRPVQDRLDNGTFRADTCLHRLSRLRARSIVYGANVRTKANLDKVRAAVHLVVATSALGGRILGDIGGGASSASVDEIYGADATVDAAKVGVQRTTRREKRESILVGLTDSLGVLPTKRESVCLDFFLEDKSFNAVYEDAADVAPAVAHVVTDSEETTLAMRRESIYSDAIGVPPVMITIL
jgi:hypothetical protein